MSHHGCPERLSNRSKGFQEEAGQATMEVLVETLTGTAFEMTVSPSDTIFAIKSKICRVEGIPVSQQHLVFGNRELEDSSSLASCGVLAGSRLRLVLGLRGGPVSTRRLPPPPLQPLGEGLERDLQPLLQSHRDDGDWACGGTGPGCRVTVVVFRDGERVNMLRVKENPDGTYSPASPPAHHDCTPSSPAPEPVVLEPRKESRFAMYAQNAVTMGKMTELRRRMESLAIRRNLHSGDGEIQKTRSEETLSVPSLLEETESEYLGYLGYDEAEEFLAADTERLKLSDALAGSILVAGSRQTGDEAAIVEECLDGEVSPCRGASLYPAGEYGPFTNLGGEVHLGGESTIWSKRIFGSHSQLSPPPPSALAPPAPAHARSASSLHVRGIPAPREIPPRLTQPLFSSSTSDLEQLRRNRLLPALSRHRNTEHLHLSDDHLHVPPPPGFSSEDRVLPPPGLGSERRQRRIEKIAQLEHSRLFRFGDFEHVTLDDNDDKKNPPKTEQKEEVKEKKIRIRCGFCRKKLSIATVHKCRCGADFCAPHRYAEVHGCAYDYKANAHQHLLRANPLVSAPKLPKI